MKMIQKIGLILVGMLTAIPPAMARENGATVSWPFITVPYKAQFHHFQAPHTPPYTPEYVPQYAPRIPVPFTTPHSNVQPHSNAYIVTNPYVSEPYYGMPYASFGPAQLNEQTNMPAQQSPQFDIDQACTVLQANPEWQYALKTASARWQVPPAYPLAMIRLNSRFDLSKNDQGYIYASAGTWEWYLGDTMQPESHHTSTENFATAVDFVAWYIAQTHRINKTTLQDPIGHYLNYQLGQGGFTRGEWRTRPDLIKRAERFATHVNRYAQQLKHCPL